MKKLCIFQFYVNKESKLKLGEASIFDVQIDDNEKFTISGSSLDPKWSHPGEKFATLENTGNGFEYHRPYETSVNLTYSDLEELMILYKAYQKQSNIKTLYKVFKVSK